MKSFIKHINGEEDILDKKPKEVIDEAATMGDFLLGLGAAGGLLALKKDGISLVKVVNWQGNWPLHQNKKHKYRKMQKKKKR